MKGEGPTYVKHIKAGVEAALKDKEALLVFSGGETEESVGPRSEGGSYFELADALGLITEELLPRVTTEWHALDSYQNLLFSIARFHEYTNNYPSKITVISHDFKKHRFVDVHRKAVGFPEERFEFIGIDPPVMSTDAAEGVKKSEGKTVEQWEADPYACDETGVLVEKRKTRGWSRRGDGYWDRCEEMRELLTFCPSGGVKWFEGSLPWRKG
ncbi:hypothetical protein BJ508DRAFT_319991 [Ascobolus immersus RN42]|uniref:DUF218 domain-containing protein n=1 Tax=Ascobolus immersus RN42 TaxID=1160509 RepID=A0A3N4H802_ASCIM|nr:hypothetical protein BJ508DRAFT_319991 [Ascobolus immersus RN42]